MGPFDCGKTSLAELLSSLALLDASTAINISAKVRLLLRPHCFCSSDFRSQSVLESEHWMVARFQGHACNNSAVILFQSLNGATQTDWRSS